MYINRTCPLVNKQNQVIGREPWACQEPGCRFQIDGVCAVIGAFYESRDNRKMLNEISQRVGVR